MHEPERPAPGAAAAVAPAQPDAARFGNPSFVWRFGQDRRFAMVAEHVDLAGKRVLDLGCGLGEYVRAFERAGALPVGADIVTGRLAEARRRGLRADPPGAAGYLAAAGESLPFRDGSLDLVFMNEVIEHVADDRRTLEEVARVLAPGGACVLFAPNRLYPFETHGIYLRRRYVFGNIPLVNWLPGALRDRLVPHARAYRHGAWRRLTAGTALRVETHGYVFPGFDNVASRSQRLARLLRATCYWSERHALRRFGLSHFVVLRRAGGPA